MDAQTLSELRRNAKWIGSDHPRNYEKKKQQGKTLRNDEMSSGNFGWSQFGTLDGLFPQKGHAKIDGPFLTQRKAAQQ